MEHRPTHIQCPYLRFWQLASSMILYEVNRTGFLNDKVKLVTCDSMAAMLAFVINTFVMIFVMRDHAVSMGRAQRLLPTWRPSCSAMRVPTLGWLRHLLPKGPPLSTPRVLLPSSIFALLLFLSLLVQPAMGSVTAANTDGPAATNKTDRNATQHPVLNDSMSPGATTSSGAPPPSPLAWTNVYFLPQHPSVGIHARPPRTCLDCSRFAL